MSRTSTKTPAMAISHPFLPRGGGPSPNTAKEAYNRGMLFSYFTSKASELICGKELFCFFSRDAAATNTNTAALEMRWSGHQPLSPDTCSRSNGEMSPYELRIMRQRRRRGVLQSTLLSPLEERRRSDSRNNSNNYGVPSGSSSSMEKSLQDDRQGKKPFIPSSQYPVQHSHDEYKSYIEELDSAENEAPAPTPVAAPPAAAEASKATTATSAAIEKRKSRQSFSVPKGAAEDLAQQVEPQPPAARASTGSVTGSVTGASLSGASATTSVSGSYQGLSQVGSPPSALRELPALRDAPPNKREELFKLKLQLCGVIFSFDDPTSDKRGKDMKRQTLLELVDYVNTPAGQKIFTESVMSDLMAMVSANVCRALPPATDDFDPEEDEPVLESAWPHLQVAYEFFLRFIVSSEVNAKAAKKYVDQRFCLQLVELFDSEDPRERDYLKTILHRIYGKFMSHRSFIRRAISNVFYRFVYETERHNGIGELLEILGSIINGFAIPLKKEHLQFLVRALIPLHKPKCVGLYHQQLSYCIIQYVEKDADTATPILNGFFKCWPWSCSGKQVLFLNELEEILELLGADQLNQISKTLFTNLARCLDSDHFQVVERALFLWNNEHLVNSGCLSRLNAQTVLPIIYGPLYKNSSGHWNATVEGLAQNVLKMYMEYDLVLYDQCTTAYFKEEEEAKRKIQAIADRWQAIEKLATAKRNQRMIAAA
ncbi:hypothetical protein ACHAW5_001226 [Stephanodiscus triporus]|uniref:Serine/threonine protein phosphatase 2A regulatory subunit n=1 Tax=Stephanodiscus triporus TaxID=2934178 RepID=A0ABD3MFE7_9STRA